MFFFDLFKTLVDDLEQSAVLLFASQTLSFAFLLFLIIENAFWITFDNGRWLNLLCTLGLSIILVLLIGGLGSISIICFTVCFPYVCAILDSKSMSGCLQIGSSLVSLLAEPPLQVVALEAAPSTLVGSSFWLAV